MERQKMAHEGLWQQLDKLDRHQTAKRASCQYLTNPEHFVVRLLNTEYIVNLADRKISSVRSGSPPEPAAFLEQLCILAYLINARDLPLANKIVKAETLPGGQFFFRGIHSLPADKLQSTFGDNPKALHRIVEQFNAKICQFGDASIELYVLPRIPLTIVIWQRDEEFDSRASILFDQTAAAQLPLDALLTAANLTVQALVKAAQVIG